MAVKVNQRVMLTKRLLKDSLVDLLTVKDIYQVSIRELCDNAGVNRSTFYKYYGSQFDLLKEMEQDMIEHITNTLENRWDDVSPETMIGIFEYLEDNIRLSRLLINNNVDPDFPDKLFRLQPIQDGLVNILKDQFEPCELEYVYTYFTCGCFNFIRKWINKDDRESAGQMTDILLKLLWKLKPVR